ncbi:MAG: primosomal protein N' [Bacteroidales bacterium 45-6]|nr:MAG: primosomal protein N' [Bacteroidales bacterium 45-6]
MFYIDVILPLPLAGLFTYSAPTAVERGCRVIVQFGAKKFYSAIVAECYEPKEPKPGIKEITSVLDEQPVILPSQLQFWDWISIYYMCHLGEVCKAALPAALKLESATRVSVIEEAYCEERLSPSETKIFDLLSDGKIYDIAEIARKAGVSNPIPGIRSLLEKGLIAADEQLGSNFSPKSETVVRLRTANEEDLHAAMDQLRRAPKQLSALTTFLSQMPTGAEAFSMPAKKLMELSGANAAALKGLVEKNIFLLEKKEMYPLEGKGSEVSADVQLNGHQQRALAQIEESFQEKNITLLHGVTSSGKTEIYIKLIAEQLAAGKQVLYLLPEIALTMQITTRLRAVFGERLAVYHSRFTDNERAEVWNSMVKDKGCQVVLGVRSSIFLPFRNLGLVIVDEEHEASYKQQDPAPRYHGRNAAIVLASIHQAKVLLGTATPAIETYFNAMNGKYGLVELHQRHESLDMPLIQVVNTKELRRKKIMKSAIFSPQLLAEMERAFEKGEQVMLFRNRRGFAPYMECKACAWSPKCHNCDVSLTYHKYANLLSCHYCGATYPVLHDCPSCQSKDSMVVVGFGTERVEEEIMELFPGKRIARMDLDTTRSKKSYEQIIDGFAKGKTDILIGTQMISKGLDFDKVSLVGIIQADSLFNQPDFRAHERGFQMLEQVSGRAGRKHKRGLVVLQTTNPDSQIIQAVCEHDYLRFYKKEIAERETFKYPPFYRILHVILRGKDRLKLGESSEYLSVLLRRSFGNRVLGPIEPPVAKVQTLFIRRIIIKTECNASPSVVREQLRNTLDYFNLQDISKSILVHVDVDPM